MGGRGWSEPRERSHGTRDRQAGTDPDTCNSRPPTCWRSVREHKSRPAIAGPTRLPGQTPMTSPERRVGVPCAHHGFDLGAHAPGSPVSLHGADSMPRRVACLPLKASMCAERRWHWRASRQWPPSVRGARAELRLCAIRAATVRERNHASPERGEIRVAVAGASNASEATEPGRPGCSPTGAGAAGTRLLREHPSEPYFELAVITCCWYSWKLTQRIWSDCSRRSHLLI